MSEKDTNTDNATEPSPIEESQAVQHEDPEQKPVHEAPVLSTPEDFEQAKPLKKSNKAKKGDGFFYTIMGFLLVGILALGGYYWFSNQEEPQVMLVVDVNFLVVAQLKDRLDTVETPEAATEAATQFMADLKEITSELASQGYIVLNANNLLGYPEAIDITPLVADRLNIDLKLGE